MNGIERQIDKLGRIVLPIGYRKRLGLHENSKVTVSICGDVISITPSEDKCILCGRKDQYNRSLRLCSDCIDKIKNEI